MPLVKTIHNSSELYNDLKAMGRTNFSYEGANALQEYLEELSYDIGENIDYDPIAFCCEYSEYADALDCVEDCQYDCDFEDIHESDREEHALEYLKDNTLVIEFSGGIIIANF